MDNNKNTPEVEEKEVDTAVEPTQSAEKPAEEPTIIEEIVIEEVGIDGMCGVY